MPKPSVHAGANSLVIPSGIVGDSPYESVSDSYARVRFGQIHQFWGWRRLILAEIGSSSCCVCLSAPRTERTNTDNGTGDIFRQAGVLTSTSPSYTRKPVMMLAAKMRPGYCVK